MKNAEKIVKGLVTLAEAQEARLKVLAAQRQAAITKHQVVLTVAVNRMERAAGVLLAASAGGGLDALGCLQLQDALEFSVAVLQEDAVSDGARCPSVLGCDFGPRLSDSFVERFGGSA